MSAGNAFSNVLFGDRKLALGVGACTTGLAVLSGDAAELWPFGRFMLATGLLMTLVITIGASRAARKSGAAPCPVPARNHLALTTAGALPLVLGVGLVGTGSAPLALAVMPMFFWGFHAHRNSLGRAPVVLPYLVAVLCTALALVTAGAGTAEYANAISGIIVGFGFSCAAALGLEMAGRRGHSSVPSGQPAGPASGPEPIRNR